jgi:hypothetical protein
VLARWINQDLNEGVLDQINLYVVLDKIPIGKKFGISWIEEGLLPYVERYNIETEKIIDAEVRFKENDILGFIYRFGFEVIFNNPSEAELPDKIIAQVRRVTVQDLTNGDKYHLGIAKTKIYPHYYLSPVSATMDSSVIEFISGGTVYKSICIGSPEETRTPVSGSRARHAWPLHHRAFP